MLIRHWQYSNQLYPHPDIRSWNPEDTSTTKQIAPKAHLEMSLALYILDEDLHLLIHRQYRRELDSAKVIDKFRRSYIEALPACSPVLRCGSWTFVYVKCDSIYLMMPVYGDANVVCLITFLHKFTGVLRNYLSSYGQIQQSEWQIDADSIRDNYILLYELFDETLDWGIPQLTEFSILKEYVRPQNTNVIESEKGNSDGTEKQISNEVNASISRSSMAKISWRPKGIFYDKNEFFMNFEEHLKFKYNFKARRLMLNTISGEINCTSYLSGMPTLKLELNEPFKRESVENATSLSISSANSIFSNVNYHQCVQIDDSDEHLLTFIPPDGRFKLLSYQILHTDSLRPLIVIRPRYIVYSKNGHYRLRIKLKILTTFKRKYNMSDISIVLPLFVPVDNLVFDFDKPFRFSTKIGRVVHNLCENTITWQISRMDGLSRGQMVSEFELTTRQHVDYEHRQNIFHNRQTKNDIVYYHLRTKLDKLRGTIADSELSSALESTTSIGVFTEKNMIITVNFTLEAMLYSGLKVNFLQVQEPELQFEAFPWVRYRISCGKGDYLFVMCDDQIYNRLSKAELDHIQQSIEEIKKEEDALNSDTDRTKVKEEEASSQVSEGKLSSQKEDGSNERYKKKAPAFEEYKLEGEE